MLGRLTVGGYGLILAIVIWQRVVIYLIAGEDIGYFDL